MIDVEEYVVIIIIRDFADTFQFFYILSVIELSSVWTANNPY